MADSGRPIHPATCPSGKSQFPLERARCFPSVRPLGAARTGRLPLQWRRRTGRPPLQPLSAGSEHRDAYQASLHNGRPVGVARVLSPRLLPLADCDTGGRDPCRDNGTARKNRHVGQRSWELGEGWGGVPRGTGVCAQGSARVNSVINKDTTVCESPSQ